MIRIGYVRLRDARHGADPSEQAAALKAQGCHVVRGEAPRALGGTDFTVLNSILDFIAGGDELVVHRLEHLGASGRGLLQVLERLEARGASLRVVEPELCSSGPGGPALRAALEAVAAIEPTGAARPRRPVPPLPQQADQLKRRGRRSLRLPQPLAAPHGNERGHYRQRRRHLDRRRRERRIVPHPQRHRRHD